jgi:RNA-dependent RNA polymerase
MCKICNIPDSKQILIRCDLPGAPQTEACSRGFFLRKHLYRLRQEILKFPWSVGFHLEGLLHNGRLNTAELERLLPRIRKLCQERPQRDHAYMDDFLRKYGEAMQDRNPRVSPTACFEDIRRRYIPPKMTLDIFRCRHVTFTPTRMLMEGPYATQSNRIIRQFSGYEEFFIRVDFRDEDRLQYRWSREVDGASFVRERVGTILKEGFTIAGRHFEFLAYSSSALREHAVWFMSPFDHHDPKYGRVDSMKIRDQIGDFKGTELMKQPSKYAARLAQAFTATEASVSIKRSEWEEIEDIKPPNFEDGKPNPYLFTDGVGSISKSLGDKIWAELCSNRRDHGEKSVQPSAVRSPSMSTSYVIQICAVPDSVPWVQRRGGCRRTT